MVLLVVMVMRAVSLPGADTGMLFYCTLLNVGVNTHQTYVYMYLIHVQNVLIAYPDRMCNELLIKD